MDEPDTTTDSPAPAYAELCWNFHIGVRCQSTIMLIMSPDIPRILGSAKSLLASVKSESHPNNPMSIREEHHNGVTHNGYSIPIRWRVDFSMLEGVVILPGKGYKYSSSRTYYDAGGHLRVSNSLRLSIEPDPLKSGNVSIHLSSRSFVVLNSSANIVEPFTLSFNVMTLPRILKIQPINVELGALDTPISWLMDRPTTNAQLTDGLDLSLSVHMSPVLFNLPTPLLTFLKEIGQMHASKQVVTKQSTHGHEVSSSSTGQNLNISLALEIASLSMTLIDESATPNCKTQLLIEAIRVEFISDAVQIDTQISACDMGLFFTEDSTTMPIFYTSSIDNSRDKAFLFSSKLIKCAEDQAKLLKLLVNSGSSYVTLIPSFIRQISQLLLETKDKKYKESRISSQDDANSSNLVQKVRHFLGYPITFIATSDGLHLVLPSQDFRLLNEQRDPVLNTICLSWTQIAVTLTSSDLQGVDGQSFSALLHQISSKEKICIGEDLMSFKADIKACFDLTRTTFSLDAHILPIVYRISQQQVIVSPFCYTFTTSLIMLGIPNSSTYASSLGLHLDIGDVDILWHAASSSFGLSDALKVSLIPLFKNETPIRSSVSSRQDFDSSSLQITSPIQHTRLETVDRQTKVPKLPEKVYSMFKDTLLMSSVRLASIQVVLVPSNSKEVSSPIMKLSISALRTGVSMMKCQSSGGMRVSSDSRTSCLYYSQWLDFTVNAHYHNRRLVIYEPLIEQWAGNFQCCANVSDIFGMQPFEVEMQETDEALSNITSDSNRLTRFIEGMKNLHIRRDDEHKISATRENLLTSLDLCHIIQSSIESHYVEQAIHPARVHGDLNAKEIMFTKVSSSTNDVSAVLSLSNGKADHQASPPPVPLNINITGALIENLALMISERTENEQIAPHYIINQTGLTMCWEVDKAMHSRYSLREIKPGEQEELRIVGFPHRSFICIELYNSLSTNAFRLRSVGKIDVDLVGIKKYDLQTLGNQATPSFVIVR